MLLAVKKELARGCERFSHRFMRMNTDVKRQEAGAGAQISDLRMIRIG